MVIEFHDTEVGNTLAGRWNNIDYDYQAEEIIQENALGHSDIVRFVLLDDQGERAVWEKSGVAADSVTLTKKSDRFTGQWELGLSWTEAHYERKYGKQS
jgi:hypothetical protein